MSRGTDFETGGDVSELADKRPGEPGMTQDEMRERVIRLIFEGSRRRYDEFRQAIREAVPPGTTAVIRGSGVTGERWKDGSEFDAKGPGTSDIDLTLVGDKVLEFFKLTGFFVPGVHSRPLSDEDPEIAPDLIPLRAKLMAMVGRPVNIQGTRDIVKYFRGDVLGQPYLTLFDKPEDE
jgi:hypothetical protein